MTDQSSKGLSTKEYLTQKGGWLGLVIAVLYWFVESAFDSALFHEGVFWERFFSPDPNEAWMRLLIVTLFIFIGVYIETTAREKTLEKQKRQVESSFGEILEIAADAIIMIDAAHRITLFNRGAEAIFGYDAVEVMGRPLTLLMPEPFRKGHAAHIQSFGEGLSSARLIGDRVCPIFGRRKNGEEFPAEASISKLDRNGETVYTSILRDVSERQKADKTIRKLAFYDSVTGLINRNRFNEILRETLKRGAEEDKSIALLLLDLDRFKEVNDTLGHPRGDILLREVGLRLKALLRPSDAVARLGGDEFALLLPLAEEEHARFVAAKIMAAMGKPFKLDGFPISLETSLGIALFPGHGTQAGTLLQHADVAMYEAKRRGCCFLIYAPEEDHHSRRQLALMGSLRDAIEDDQLRLHFQPKIHLSTGKLVGVEALVRWEHPEEGMIPPDQFILPAEQTGLIRPLTEWVLREALLLCDRLSQIGISINIAVNLSARNLHDPNLPNLVLSALGNCHVPPSFLELELTESAIMTDEEGAQSVLEKLRGIGVRIAIDDFGVGYSSLVYLKKLAVDVLKIDKSFVKNMSSNEDDAIIVRSTIDLAHNLGLKVIAEGVENKETWDQLAALGCDTAQGYYVSRPLPEAKLIKWLKEEAPQRGWSL